MAAVAARSPFPAPLLVLDAGAPRPSAAVALAGELLGEASAPGGPSAPPPVALASRALAAAGLAPGDLGGVVAVRGPGSFTGLRLGLATAWALHAALGIPATAIPSFEALARQLGPEGSPALALVDALRGEWFAQLLATTPEVRPLSSPERLPASALAGLGARTAIGFALEPLALSLPGVRLVAAAPLAPAGARQLSLEAPAWDPTLLLQPLYLRAPTRETRLGADAPAA
ncbi:MAG TPA: tRNA (adenosine(37)-N6)-threonylcarbamoyltransferase complex dimerization subunit type 1 TsaB [Thermoanaerobaculia bacterium]|nr:tRNA (adenosine(37)-N6)-threonylcarbamoyltransferase complex dimerization subunit type 1 TsaB [Thermoanaerobaculia bacterium]